MNTFETLLNKINFKKAVKIYLTISLCMLLICFLSILFVSRDKISMALHYHDAADTIEHEGANAKLKTQLESLASTSTDIINIIAVDRNNNILYKTSSTLVNGTDKFILRPYEPNKSFLQDNVNNDTIYKVVRNESLIFNSGYIENHQKLVSDIDDEAYYEHDWGSKNINLLNYLVNRHTGDKIYVIRTVTPIPYAERLFEVTGLLIGLIFMIYWLGLALWVYRDASRKRTNASLWGLLVLIANLIGVIIYTMYKQNGKVCYQCGTLQNKENAFCTFCGTQINEQCSNCGSIVTTVEHYCGKCGNEL